MPLVSKIRQLLLEQPGGVRRPPRLSQRFGQSGDDAGARFGYRTRGLAKQIERALIQLDGRIELAQRAAHVANPDQAFDRQLAVMDRASIDAPGCRSEQFVDARG